MFRVLATWVFQGPLERSPLEWCLTDSDRLLQGFRIGRSLGTERQVCVVELNQPITMPHLNRSRWLAVLAGQSDRAVFLKRYAGRLYGKLVRSV